MKYYRFYQAINRISYANQHYTLSGQDLNLHEAIDAAMEEFGTNGRRRLFEESVEECVYLSDSVISDIIN